MRSSNEGEDRYIANPAVAIRIEEVWKTYRSSSLPALRGVFFSVPEGTHVALVGPDGAGKTTLLKILAGILKPDRGRVSILGKTWETSHLYLKRQIGYLSQQPGIYGELTVRENLEFFADLQGVHSASDRIEELLSLTELAPFRKRLASRLSGGMFQKLALACAIIHHPRLLFLDEPTTGVDPVARREFHALLDQLRREGVTLCMATPAMDEASRCKEVILLYGGTVLTQGDPALLSNQVQGFVYEVVSPNPRQVAEELKVQYPHWSIQVFGDRLHVTVPEEEERANEEGDPIERIRAAIPAVAGKSSEDRGRLCRVRPIRPGLEDVFIALVSRNERETSNPNPGGTADAEGN